MSQMDREAIRTSYLKAIGYQPPFYDYDHFLALKKIADDMYVVLINELGSSSVTVEYEKLFELTQ